MSDEHNIDRLFQESFKDFEVDAPNSTWGNIEKHLTQNSTKRIFPIWQKLSGVAAIIAVLIIVGSQWLIRSSQPNNNPTVNKTQKNSLKNNSHNQINGIVTTQNDEILNQIYNTGSPQQNKYDDYKTRPLTVNNQNQDSKLNKLGATPVEKNTVKLAQNNTSTKSLKTTVFEENLAFLSKILSKDLIRSPEKTIQTIPLESLTQNKLQSQKKSLVEVAENLNKKDKFNATNSDRNSWFIKPQISPIFYGNLGSGSAIDANLAQNDSRGEVNMSYGVNVAYQFNEKIKLRTGVNRVNLNYTTKDVYLVENQSISNLNNININSNFNASVLSRQQLEDLSANSALNRSETITSQLQQELGYIEIPMEVEYKILNTKVDINLVGGASTLVLNKNNLDIKNNNGTTSVGEANNLNNLSFSTNFAIGFDYSISERLMFNLEPTFKYQFNTFQSSSTDFQPYFLGVYSGLVFKF